MRNYNVFLLSVGRRVELVNCFRNAASKLNIDSQLIGGDSSELAPASFVCDKKRKLPKISDPSYIDAIITACVEENIALIVPTIDTDLLLLARNKQLIEEKTNAKLLISDESIIEICRDKVKTQRFLEANCFLVPKLYEEEELLFGDLKFPLFMKPKSGSSSINAFKIHTTNELHLYKQLINDPMVQECIEGEEYTVDVFLDYSGQVITIVPRLRMATRSGEIAKGKIVKDKEIIKDVQRLMKVLKPIGHITVQLMKTARGIEYIEVNPRFGGGAPMSIQSGADSCENLYKLLMGQSLAYNEDYRDNLIYLRFDQSICINDNLEIVT